jgi:hypothetical protein
VWQRNGRGDAKFGDRGHSGGHDAVVSSGSHYHLGWQHERSKYGGGNVNPRGDCHEFRGAKGHGRPAIGKRGPPLGLR